MKIVQFLKCYNVDVDYFCSKNLLYLKIFNKVYIIILPFFFFKKEANNKLFLLFTSNFLYKTFLSVILNVLSKYNFIYYFRLRMEGLGYRLRKYRKDLYRFFFGLKHFFYLYIPIGLIFKSKRRKFIVLSNDLVKLNNFFSQMIFLKKMDFYERNNTFLRTNKIMYIKKRK